MNARLGVCQSLFFLMLAASAVRAQQSPYRSKPPPSNEFGWMVKTDGGSPIQYDQAELAAQARLQVVSAPDQGTCSTVAPLGPPTPSLLFAYAGFGTGIGLSGIATATVNGRTEIYCGGSGSTFGGNAYWYALTHNAVTGNYDMVYVSPVYSSGVTRLAVADVRAEPGPEIVTLLGDGTIEVLSASTKQRLATFPTSITSATAMRLFDLDGDSLSEIFVADTNEISAFHGTGTLAWSHSGVGGYDLAIGQMDADASLEVATTDGHVIDVATGTIQCTWNAGFGFQMALSDFDNDGMQELIFAEYWGFCWGFDVDTCLPKWSLPIFNVGAIAVVDADGNGTDELVIGDAQWGDVHAHSLTTQQQLWTIHNPEHGTTWIAVDDVDEDGVPEVLWGSGASSSGSDRLYVGDPATQSIEWENVQLEGPFIGPRVGDVDGDGDLEVVSVSTSSDSGYGSGRIVVLDAQTFEVQSISQEIMQGFGWTGIHDLELRNVDADPALEIVTGGDRLYDGLIEVYNYAAGPFPLLWDNNTLPSGAPFYSVDVADIDGDGHLEVVGGVGTAHSGAQGVFVYVYDYDTGVEKWHTFHLGWSTITDLALADSDGDGGIEIHAMVAGLGTYIFDGTSHAAQDMIPGSFRCLQIQGAAGSGVPHIWMGDDAGQLQVYRWNGTDNVLRRSFQLINGGPLKAFSFGRLGSVYAAGDQGVLSLVYPLATTTVRWSLSGWGTNLGRNVTRVPSVPMIVTSSDFAILAFQEP